MYTLKENLSLSLSLSLSQGKPEGKPKEQRTQANRNTRKTTAQQEYVHIKRKSLDLRHVSSECECVDTTVLFTHMGIIVYSISFFSVASPSTRHSLHQSWSTSTKRNMSSKICNRRARGKRCGALLDPRWFHASDGCKAIRYQRHYGIAKALSKVFRRAEYQVQLERQVLMCADSPADLYIPDWLENRALAVDITADITAVAAHRGEGKEPRAKVVGALLGQAERKKEKRHRKVIHPGFRSTNVVYSLRCIILREYGQESEGFAQASRNHNCGSRTNLTSCGSSANCGQIVSAVMRPVADAISATLDQRGFERT